MSLTSNNAKTRQRLLTYSPVSGNVEIEIHANKYYYLFYELKIRL
jgi:hypothetical protein